MPSPHVVKADGGQAYSPVNHTGTSNRRVISRSLVGARHVEVLIGTIVKGHGALRHAHPTLEQASYLLEGEGLSEVDGVERVVRPGRWKFNPEGSPHRFTVTSDTPVKVVVVYAPPYAEDPQGAIRCEDLPQSGRAAESGPDDAIAPAAARDFVPDGHSAISLCPVITRETMGAKHMAIYDASFGPDAVAVEQSFPGMEKVIQLREGSLAGTIDGTPFQASAGDWIFIPEGATHAYSARFGAGASAFVIHAGSIPQET